MWTVAAANKKFKGPLGSYNGLTDVHLAHYFSHPFRKSHLKKSKLITEDDVIIPETRVKTECLQHEKKKKFYDMLASAIVQNAVHAEGVCNTKICNKLEDLTKIELVEKIKVALRKKSGKVSTSAPWINSSNPHSPSVYKFLSDNGNHEFKNKISPLSSSVTSSYICPSQFVHPNMSCFKRCLSAKCSSPYLVPLLLNGSNKRSVYSLQRPQTINICTRKRRKKKKGSKRFSSNMSLNHSESKDFETFGNFKKLSVQNQQLTLNQSRVTLCYHGYTWPINCQKFIAQDILIKQQHCGGSSITVYRGRVTPEGTLTFMSLRHEGFPFSITVFVDSIRDLKLSSCCEYRYLCGRRIGGTNGCFSIYSIEGGFPCIKCQYREIDSPHPELHNGIMKMPTFDYGNSTVDGTFTFKHPITENHIQREKEDSSVSIAKSIEVSLKEKWIENESSYAQHSDQDSVDEPGDEIEEILSQLDIEEHSVCDEIIPEEPKNNSTSEVILKNDNEESSSDSQSSIHSEQENTSTSEKFSRPPSEGKECEIPFSDNLNPGSSSEDDCGEHHVVLASVHASSEDSI